MPSFDLFQGCHAALIAILTYARFQVGERNLELWPFGENDRALDDILQFADVSRPRVADKSVHGIGGNRLDLLLHVSGEMLRKVSHEKWNIFCTFAQRRDIDGKHI